VSAPTPQAITSPMFCANSSKTSKRNVSAQTFVICLLVANALSINKAIRRLGRNSMRSLEISCSRAKPLEVNTLNLSHAAQHSPLQTSNQGSNIHRKTTRKAMQGLRPVRNTSQPWLRIERILE
jgi:hypothetical protein